MKNKIYDVSKRVQYFNFKTKLKLNDYHVRKAYGEALEQMERYNGLDLSQDFNMPVEGRTSLSLIDSYYKKTHGIEHPPESFYYHIEFYHVFIFRFDKEFNGWDVIGHSSEYSVYKQQKNTDIVKYLNNNK